MKPLYCRVLGREVHAVADATRLWSRFWVGVFYFAMEQVDHPCDTILSYASEKETKLAKVVVIDYCFC